MAATLSCHAGSIYHHRPYESISLLDLYCRCHRKELPDPHECIHTRRQQSITQTGRGIYPTSNTMEILPFRSQEILYFYLNFRNITLIFNLLPFFATENSARIYNHCIAATIISNIISMSHICKAIDRQA